MLDGIAGLARHVALVHQLPPGLVLGQHLVYVEG